MDGRINRAEGREKGLRDIMWGETAPVEGYLRGGWKPNAMKTF